MKNITAALASLTPLWTQIANISGVPGVSIGVFHEGKVIFRDSIGYRDFEQKLSATSDTVYPIGSLSKAFTASIYGSLVDEGLVNWDSPIRDILPDFRSVSSEIENLATAIDLLSYRTGITEGEPLFFHVQSLLNDTGIVVTYPGLPQAEPFRSSIEYNNLSYSLVSQTMTQVTKKNYSDLLERYITQPLGLERTGVELDRRQLPNTAKRYLATDDGSVIENPRSLYFEGTHMLASDGIWSSVDDLLTFYREVLNAAITDAEAPQSPLRQLSTILTGHTSQRKSFELITYGLGWTRTQLPSEVGAIGLNSWLVKKMPIIGRNSPSRLAIYHQGNVPGATSAVYLFPETMSGVVVLANAYGLSDVPDWIAQSIIETLFEGEIDTPYLQLAEEAVSASREWCAKTVKDLATLENSNPDSAPTRLDRYIGEYWNSAETFRLVVILDGGAFKVQFQGFAEDEFELKHLHDDVFSWFTSPRDMTERGRHVFGASYYLIDFQRGEGRQKVTGLRWAHGGGETGGKLFKRTETDAERDEERKEEERQDEEREDKERRKKERDKKFWQLMINVAFYLIVFVVF